MHNPDFPDRRLWLVVWLALVRHWLHRRQASPDLYRFDALALTLV